MAILPDRDALTTPADGDLYVTTDVSDTTDAATGTDKKITWASIKTALTTVFDALYQSIPAEGEFADGDKTKLDGIEALADVTDTANVTSAGALMDSELTSIADVKALDQSVVSGASPTFTTTNFTDATNKRLMTDAQETVLDNTSGTNTGDEAAADLTTAGVVELATVAETNTGTDATRAVTPDGLDGWTGSAQVTTVGTLSSGDADAIVTDASDSAKGKVELATIAETDTGTDTARAVTPDGLQGSIRNLRFVDFIVVDAATDCATGTDLIEWECPFACTIVQDDSNPAYFSAWNATAGTTGTMVIDIHKAGTTIMTTNKLDIETGETSTRTATTQPDLTTTTLAAGDLITIDVDAVHTTAAKGLTVRMALRLD